MTARKNYLLSTTVFFIEDVTMLAAYVPILAMLGIALFIAVFVITLSRFLGPAKPTVRKLAPYE
jgi:NADH:ubiquinone oxidoreductase subunit 3 (subunit A)